MNKDSQKNSNWLAMASILGVGALAAFAIIYAASTRRPADGTAGISGGAGNTPNAAELAGDSPSIGNPDAPVTIVEFSDFQCPFCSTYYFEIEKRLIEDYVKTGKARFVYRQFPIASIHEYAEKASEASLCANAQGKFWEYHDILFSRQSQLNFANLKVWAKELGLDETKFNSCLDSGKFAAQVEKDFEDARKADVRGTPATFINGTFISGTRPYEDFRAAIETELAKSGK